MTNENDRLNVAEEVVVEILLISRGAVAIGYFEEFATEVLATVNRLYTEKGLPVPVVPEERVAEMLTLLRNMAGLFSGPGFGVTTP